MDADQPLKVLFRTRPRDLLGLTGDAGARVLSAQILELSAAKRSVDLVLFLRRGAERYVRHVEFQARHRADLALRCFEYATRLVAQLRVPRTGRPRPSSRTCWRSCRVSQRDVTLPGSWRG
jgi:hypothetical protein